MKRAFPIALLLALPVGLACQPARVNQTGGKGACQPPPPQVID
jgi:hypothetical protein